MPGGVDLHTHTTASDGTYAPRELVAEAASRGVRVLAITDHDSIGLEEVLERGALLQELGARDVRKPVLSTLAKKPLDRRARADGNRTMTTGFERSTKSIADELGVVGDDDGSCADRGAGHLRKVPI